MLIFGKDLTKMKIIFIYTLGWSGMAILAILNGMVREKAYAKYMSELSAHHLSTLSALIVFSVYIVGLSSFCRIESTAQAAAIGGIWFVMTVGFEFVFGRYVVGHSWERLLRDYNILEGRVWILVLVWIAAAPYVVFSLGA